MTPMWLAAKITGPVAGTWWVPWTRTRTGGGARTARPDAAAAVQQEPAAGAAALPARGSVGGDAHAGSAGRRSTSATTWSIDLVEGVRRGVDVDGAVGHHQRRGRPAGVDPVAGEQRLLGGGRRRSRPPRRPGARRGPPGRRSGRPSPRRRATTTEPMSRPSTTMPPSPIDRARCSSSSRARTSGTALTGRTAALTRRSRIARGDVDRRRR